MKRSERTIGVVPTILLILASALTVLAQAPSPTPTPDQRGLGVRSGSSQTDSKTDQQAREAKPELVLQTGYNNLFGATRLVFSPDGRLLATTTMRSSTIKLWETATGRELRDLSSGTQAGMTMSPNVAFSRDSRLVAAAAGDNTIKIWEVVSGREVQTLAGSQGGIASSISGVYFIAFTADGRVVTISDAIRIWDTASGQELRLISLGMVNPSALMGGGGGAVLTPDGSQLAFISTEEGKPQIKFWDLSSGREARSINLQDKEVDSLELSIASDGRVIMAGIVDKRLKVWDVGGKGNERDLGPTTTDYGLIRITRDGRLIGLAEVYAVKVWEVATGRELPSLNAPNSGLFTTQGRIYFGFSDDGKRVATGGFDTPTVLWDTETAKQLVKMSGRTDMAYKVAFSADGARLWSGGRIRWDLREGRGSRISAQALEGRYGVPSPDGKTMAVFTANSDVLTILEVPSGKPLQRLAPSATGSVVQRASFSPDGTLLVTGYGPGMAQQQNPASLTQGGLESQLKIWEVKSGREVRTLTLDSPPSDAGFSADGRTMGILGSMGQISLWDIASGQRLRDLTSSPLGNLSSLTRGMPNPGAINPGSINPKTIKRGSLPAMVMPNIADLSAMMTNMMGALAAGTMGRSVTSLAFSPDGRTLATGGVSSKSNFDFASMMSGAMPGQKGQKKSSKNPPDSQDIIKDMKVEAVGTVKLWDVTSGQEIGALQGHGKGVTSVAFSRDGRLLASGGTDNTIRIWDLATKQELRTLAGHSANIESIDFSPDGRLLASASDDGGTFLWDANTGEHLLTLISLDEGSEWMVVTPQGLFDGTPVSWNQILWRYNHDTFNVAPIEWFFNEFYYPGLLSDILAGKRPRVSQDVSKKDRRQPLVKLSLAPQPGATPEDPAGLTSRKVKIKIEVTDAAPDKDNPQGTGARDLRLFRNGSLVRVWHGDVLKGQPSAVLDEEITVAAGPNRLTAYAFNKDNVKSKDAQLSLTGADSLKRGGTAYVIAVGINEYANPQYNLKYAVADAESFGEEVQRRQRQVGRFERIEVIPLLNENATKANILAALRRLAGAAGPPSLKAGPLDRLKRAEPEDVVIIYFAGHGTAQAQRFYLIPQDLGYNGDRNKLSEEGLQSILSHSISDLELEDAVEGLDAGHLLLIIDACNSGQALEADEKRRGPMNSKGLAQLAYEKGMYILTAAQSYQAALEAAQLGHGLLTYALVEEGLKTPVADKEPKDGVVNAREWLDFATDRVPQMQEEKMQQGRGVGLGIAFAEGEQNIADPQKRSVQRPRVFYRRELEASPLVIAKP
jgi:WD40 repeat protein/uncharacterized caspase-like protein